MPTCSPRPSSSEHYRILHDAERVIADPVVRNRGTIGGSLCHADPAEDLSAALAAIRAEVVIKSSSGERVVPVRELCTGPFGTVVGPAEIVTEIRAADPAGHRKRVQQGGTASR